MHASARLGFGLDKPRYYRPCRWRSIATVICACFGPNREEAPSQSSPLSRWVIERDGCDDGDGHCLLLRSGNTHTPRQKGSFLEIFQYGGGDSAASRYRLTRKQGLQGLRFAPGGKSQRAECRVNAGVCGIGQNTKGANRSAYRVRRFALQTSENGQGRKLNAGGGLQGFYSRESRNRPS